MSDPVMSTWAYKTPKPMTATSLMAYLQHMADFHPIEDKPILVGGFEVRQATVVDGQIVLVPYLGNGERDE